MCKVDCIALDVSGVTKRFVKSEGLRGHDPTLENVFMELTGKRLEEQAEPISDGSMGGIVDALPVLQQSDLLYDTGEFGGKIERE